MIIRDNVPRVDPLSRAARLKRRQEAARRPATPGQVRLLRRLGYPFEVPSELAADQALAHMMARPRGGAI